MGGQLTRRRYGYAWYVDGMAEGKVPGSLLADSHCLSLGHSGGSCVPHGLSAW